MANRRRVGAANADATRSGRDTRRWRVTHSVTTRCPPAEPSFTGFPPQLGAVAAAYRPPSLQHRHIGPQRTLPGSPYLGLNATHQLAHGVPAQTKLPDNCLDRPALAMKANHFVPGGPAALSPLILLALDARHRRWSVIRLRFAGDWSVYFLGRCVQGWSMSTQSGTNHPAEVFQQVPTIRCLKHLGCAERRQHRRRCDRG